MLQKSCSTLRLIVGGCWLLFVSEMAFGQTPSGIWGALERQLLKEAPAALAAEALKLGDAKRGAIVFYQPYLTCTKCHTAGEQGKPLGPELTKLGTEATGAYLVESVLKPSKTIKKGYESLVIVTDAGKTITGLLVEEKPQHIILRDASQNGKLLRVSRKSIEEKVTNKLSLMPQGLVNQLAGRQQFLDLIRYLIEIAQQGPQRALELKPSPALYAARPLPAYEKHIGHTEMIADWNEENFQRGEAIYNRLCINCHGTHDRPGSLPTSLRFASGKFKNGSDPFTMYHTLTHGFGMMVPQTWMVPKQKYDVIHYIREAYLKQHNPSQYFQVSKIYLAGLPPGNTQGPEPVVFEPWVNMDYGPSLMNTYEVGNDGSNFAYKGIAARLDPGPGGVSRGRYWMVFDHDTLRMAAGWSGIGFIDWNGIHFNGRHQVHPRTIGQTHFANSTGPGWANPADGTFHDPRFKGRDGKLYGPLPRKWAHYKGLYHYEQQTIISYTVGATDVLEMPGVVWINPHPDKKEQSEPAQPVFTRTLNIGPRLTRMVLRVADSSKKYDTPLAGVLPEIEDDNLRLLKTPSGNLELRIPKGKHPLKLTLWITSPVKDRNAKEVADWIQIEKPAQDLSRYTNGGPARWPEVLKTEAVIGNNDRPFAVDVMTHPLDNPWLCQIRLTGFDFYPDGNRAAVSAWDGDVWLVTGMAAPEHGLSWRRIASGLFQPLGVKIVDDRIYVTCRDQIVILNDLNGDGETDFYENFNNDHQVTEHFHEFAMGLQTDAAGNFYYAKSARHALPALVAHHGTLLRVSKDGSRTEILATGFRAANGVCLNPDGTFIVTDQEGHWNPKNRINWVKAGGFYGNMFGYHDVTNSSDEAMEQPLCWITNTFDRSPAELLWVDSKKWGPLEGSLLNLSYGYGKVYVVPHETIHGQVQGGMCELPLPQFPTGIIRGRFHPQNGQLYTCGMFAWAGSQQQPGGFYRIRYTGKPVHLPLKLNAKKNGMAITFSGRLDPKSAGDLNNYAVKVWSLKRTADYGSKHYNERSLSVTSATLSKDGNTLFLEIPEIKPTWSMEIRYSLRSHTGKKVDGVIHNTIHNLGNPVTKSNSD